MGNVTTWTKPTLVIGSLLWPLLSHVSLLVAKHTLNANFKWFFRLPSLGMFGIQNTRSITLWFCSKSEVVSYLVLQRYVSPTPMANERTEVYIHRRMYRLTRCQGFPYNWSIWQLWARSSKTFAVYPIHGCFQGEIINIIYGWTFLLFLGAADCELLCKSWKKADDNNYNCSRDDPPCMGNVQSI